MNIELTPLEREELLKKIAEQIAKEKYYDGSSAIRTFGLTRSSLKYIKPTYLHNHSKPRYSLEAIRDYRLSRTI